MGTSFVRLAKDLGYEASLFNLVFANNVASIKLWQKLGFRELARIPKAASLKGESHLVDARQFYYDFYPEDKDNGKSRADKVPLSVKPVEVPDIDDQGFSDRYLSAKGIQPASDVLLADATPLALIKELCNRAMVTAIMGLKGNG